MAIRLSSCIPIRYYIILVIFLSTYINYTIRTILSLSLPAMVKVKEKYAIPECRLADAVAYNKTKINYGADYDWNENVQGLILGGYFYGFVTGNLPAGIIAEWFGPYKTLFYAFLVAGILNSLCVWAAPIHWVLLFLIRIITGFTGGLGHPALQCLVGRWAPPQERGRFLCAINGHNLGTCVTWTLVGAVTKAYTWPWGFHTVTIQVVVYLIILEIFAADSPEQHKWMAPEELEFIKKSQEGRVSKTKAMPPYRAILTSFPFWTLTILHFGNLWGKYVQITGVPKFMKEVIGFDIASSGFLSSLPHLGQLIFSILFGFLGDWLKTSSCSRNFIMKAFAIISHVIPGLCMASMALIKCNGVLGIILLVVSNSMNAACVLNILTVPTELAPNFAGTIYGLISFFCGITGFIVPSITGFIITKYGNTIHAWSINFVLGGIIFCLSGIFFMIFGTAELQPWNEKENDPETVRR